MVIVVNDPVAPDRLPVGVYLSWLPLGAGAHVMVAAGAVGSKWLRSFRVFRYEIHRWRGGVIPDVASAIDSPVLVSADPSAAQRVLELALSIPAPVWGRDELRAGEMWNFNSVTSWLLFRAGIDAGDVRPPGNGRAPGWDAGRRIAGRDGGPRPAPPSGVKTRRAGAEAQRSWRMTGRLG